MSNRYTLAIVGGGSISTSFLAQLSRKLKPGCALRLVQFEPGEALGVGMPYRPDLDSVLLNTPAGALSVIPDEPGHFVDWLRRHGEAAAMHSPAHGEQVPRSVYGQYLSDTYGQAVQDIRAHGVSISVVRDRALDIDRCDGKISVLTEQSGRYMADEAVLCMGNLPTSAFRELIGCPGYFHSPYPCTQVLQQAADASHIGIAGTSLSAVDAIVSLFDMGYAGKVTAFSRRGCLPSVRSLSTSVFELRWFTRENIDALAHRQQGQLRLRDLMALLCKDVDLRSQGQLTLQDMLGTGNDPVEYMQAETDLARRGERHWQSVLYKANDIIDYAWHKLSVDERKEFSTRYRHAFTARRVAIPLANAEKLLCMLKRGQLSVKPLVSQVLARDSGFDIEFTQASGAPGATVHVDKLINATGMCLNVRLSDNVLIRNLLRRGIAVPCEFGGMRQDFESLRLLNSQGAGELPVSLLGSLGIGTFFWTNAMSVNSRLANKLVDVVIRQVTRVAEGRPMDRVLVPS